MSKYQTIISTTLGTYTSEVNEIPDENYQEGIAGMSKLVADGQYLQFRCESGDTLIFSKDILQSCVIRIKKVD